MRPQPRESLDPLPRGILGVINLRIVLVRARFEWAKARHYYAHLK